MLGGGWDHEAWGGQLPHFSWFEARAFIVFFIIILGPKDLGGKLPHFSFDSRRVRACVRSGLVCGNGEKESRELMGTPAKKTVKLNL